MKIKRKKLWGSIAAIALLLAVGYSPERAMDLQKLIASVV
jgi:uncharacterized membrane-anchored protein